MIYLCNSRYIKQLSRFTRGGLPLLTALFLTAAPPLHAESAAGNEAVVQAKSSVYRLLIAIPAPAEVKTAIQNSPELSSALERQGSVAIPFENKTLLLIRNQQSDYLVGGAWLWLSRLQSRRTHHQ